MRRGYTLVELMMVVAILSALAGMTATALAPMARRLRVTQATQLATGALALARAQARASLRCAEVDVTTPVAGQTTDTLAPAAPGAAGTLLRVWRWNDLTCAGGHTHATLLGTFPMPSTVGFTLTAPLIFLGNGRVTGGASAVVGALDGSGPADVLMVTAPGVICAAGACP